MLYLNATIYQQRPETKRKLSMVTTQIS